MKKLIFLTIMCIGLTSCVQDSGITLCPCTVKGVEILGEHQWQYGILVKGENGHNFYIYSKTYYNIGDTIVR